MNLESPTEIPKTLLILKSKASNLATSEMFLRNRGWVIYSTTDLKEALLLAIQQKYAYFMVSLDHSNRKITMVPKLIAEKFKIAVMVYAETPSPRSYRLLNEAAGDYKIYHPVTGPAIERCVSKYLQDQKSIQLFLSQPSLAEAEASVPTLTSFPLHERSAGKPRAALTKPGSLPASTYIAGRKYFPRHYGVIYRTSRASKEIMGLIRTDTSETTYQLRYWSEPKKRLHVSETLIVRGVEKSLLASVENVAGFPPQKIQSTTHSECILVESNRFSGYLVTALGRNKKMEPSFVANVQRLLFQFLRDHGEVVSESDATSMRLKPVDFEPWAHECAEFLKKSVHRGEEVALAFFPRRPARLRLDESLREDMMKIKLKDLRGDQPVDFNLYIYLENNDKYVLYTPKGRIVYSQQLERLKNKGITHMHVQKKELSGVTKYNAQNYINDLVDDFTQKHRQDARTQAA